MFKSHALRFLSPVVAAGALLAWSLGSRLHDPDAKWALLYDWEIPQLVEYLNDAGLDLHTVSVLKDGDLRRMAFLTTTDHSWLDLNHLIKSPSYIDRWQGTLYCEIGPGENAWIDLDSQWGEHGMKIGPFHFYGDPQLLTQVRVLLEKGTFRRKDG